MRVPEMGGMSVSVGIATTETAPGLGRDPSHVESDVTLVLPGVASLHERPVVNVVRVVYTVVIGLSRTPVTGVSPVVLPEARRVSEAHGKTFQSNRLARYFSLTGGITCFTLIRSGFEVMTLV